KMFGRQLELVILLVLATMATAQVGFQARELENNKLVVELPTVNFTRLYNALSLSPLYTKLLNLTSKTGLISALETATDTRTTPEAVNLRQALLTQTLAASLLQNGLRYRLTPQVPTGYLGGVPTLATNTLTRTGTPTLNNLITGQVPTGVNGLQIYGGNYAPQLGANYGTRFGNGYGYPGVQQIIGLNNLNNIPGLRVQELPYSVLENNGGLYTLYNDYNNRRRQGYRRRGSHRDRYSSEIDGYRQWLRNRYSSQRYDNSPKYHRYGYGQQNVNSYGQDDYGDDEDDYADPSETDFAEGDDFGDDYEDGDDLWRKANADTQSKLKQKKASNKEKKRIEPEQQSQQRSKR
ncbi:hypothetical protein KR215_011108, partial [Drosophila sulfurigaster]